MVDDCAMAPQQQQQQEGSCWAPAVPAELLQTIHAAVGASPVRALQQQDQQQHPSPTSEGLPPHGTPALLRDDEGAAPAPEPLQDSTTSAPETADAAQWGFPELQPPPRFDAMDEPHPPSSVPTGPDQLQQQQELRAASLQPEQEYHQHQRQLLCELWCQQQQQQQQHQHQQTHRPNSMAHSLAQDLAKAAAATAACSSSDVCSPVSSLDLSSSDSCSCLTAAAADALLQGRAGDDSTLASPASSVSGSEASSFRSSSSKKKKRVSWGSVEYRQLPPPRTSLWHQLTAGAAQLSWPTAAMCALAAIGAAAALAAVAANSTTTSGSSSSSSS